MPPPAGDWQHWVTVDCGWLAGQSFPLRGCLSLYQAADGRDPEFITVADAEEGWTPSECDGILLFGREVTSMPPIEALGVCGSELGQRWLDADGSLDIRDAYDREYQRHCPLYGEDTYAVLGGWHMLWPEMNAYDEEKGRLVLWTFRDSEPYRTNVVTRRAPGTARRGPRPA